jgi:hypothetical protein
MTKHEADSQAMTEAYRRGLDAAKNQQTSCADNC